MLVKMIYKIYALKLKDSTEIKYVGRTSESLETRLSKHKTNAKFDKNKTHIHLLVLIFCHQKYYFEICKNTSILEITLNYLYTIQKNFCFLNLSNIVNLAYFYFYNYSY